MVGWRKKGWGGGCLAIECIVFLLPIRLKKNIKCLRLNIGTKFDLPYFKDS